MPGILRLKTQVLGIMLKDGSVWLTLKIEIGIQES